MHQRSKLAASINKRRRKDAKERKASPVFAFAEC